LSFVPASPARTLPPPTERTARDHPAPGRAPVSTPVDWCPGERLIASPTLSTDEVRERFSNVEEVKPYLRFVDEPGDAA
jgi:hypothetical protein